MANFRCTVAIPTRELFSGEISYAEVPGSEGSYGVMAGHETLVTTNRPGVLTLWLDPEGHEKRFFVMNGGFAHVMGNQLSVLARMGRDADDIDIEDVRKKLNDLNKEIERLEKSSSEADAAILETHLVKKSWYELQLHAVGADR
ncbi:MAG TPA: ATP synthase F1 subunit epsilon [Candidatus Aphodovivens avistercoris]|nr:ATP synthase F1 subunit epsilon [Candidatus Aphodovivens avistercoris]